MNEHTAGRRLNWHIRWSGEYSESLAFYDALVTLAA